MLDDPKTPPLQGGCDAKGLPPEFRRLPRGGEVSRIGCVAIVKNEERHIAEWLAWQFLIGFDTVVLLDNGSTDRTKEIAASFTPRYDVRVIDWPGHGAAFQVRAYEHALELIRDEFEWVGFFDADEFLVLDEGFNLKTILAGRPEAAIAIPWRMFGSSGHKEFPKELLIEAFTGHAAPEFSPNRHVKSIVRARSVISGANPHQFKVDGAYVDLLGRPVEWGHPGCLAATPDYAGGRLHHYFTRSWAHWQARLQRGNLGANRTEKEFDAYDRNELTDNSAKRRAPEVRAILADLKPPPQLRLGIAITTFNRRNVVLELIARIRKLTLSPFELVVCDDGSEDGTIEALRQKGEIVIGGTNRGIAWNKNRGLYYLLNVARCDVALLIDDDVMPTRLGWELPWVSATWRYGHVNLGHPSHPKTVLAGAGTVEEPGLATVISGWAFSCSRHALPQIGYLDLRFGRYGHEHSDFSFRAVRAGFGGVVIQDGARKQTLFFIIDGGLKTVPTVSSGTQEELAANGRLLAELGKDQVYRHAWRDDAQMQAFLAEMAAASPMEQAGQLGQPKIYENLAAYEQARSQPVLAGAGESSVEPGLTFLVGVGQKQEIDEALAGGRKVVAVQPDARLYYALTEQFAAPIAEGRLVVENFAPAPRGGEIALLQPGDGSRPYPVATISWEELVAKHGRPARVHMGTAIPGFPAMAG